jgi:hypothetical protein
MSIKTHQGPVQEPILSQLFLDSLEQLEAERQPLRTELRELKNHRQLLFEKLLAATAAHKAQLRVIHQLCRGKKVRRGTNPLLDEAKRQRNRTSGVRKKLKLAIAEVQSRINGVKGELEALQVHEEELYRVRKANKKMAVAGVPTTDEH